MKKKFAIIVCVVLAVLIGSFLWVRGQIGITDPARLLPENTAFYAALPDVPRTALRWPKTTLAKIGAEPEVKEFLAKTKDALTKNPGTHEAGDILWKLKPGRFFAAALPGEGASLHPLLGFQYWGGQKSFDEAMARLRQQIAGGAHVEPTRENHHNVEIQTLSLPDGTTLCSATLNRWGLLANNPEALKSVLDQMAGRGSRPSLAENPRFNEAFTKLPAAPDFLAFLQTAPLLDALLEAGKPLSAQVDNDQIEMVRAAQAVAFAFKLDGANFRDAVFVLRPAPPDLGQLQHSGLSLTSPATLGYFSFLLQFEALAKLPAYSTLLRQYLSTMSDGTDPLTRLTKTLGREVSLAMSWPEGRMIPEFLAAVSVKDPAQASEFLREAAAIFPESTRTKTGEAVLYSFPTLRSAFLDPTLGLSDNLLVAGLSPDAVEGAFQRGSGSSTIKDTPAFAGVLPAFQSANECFGFINTRGLFERVFPLVRQVAMFGSSLLPGSSQWVDLKKLPQTETIAQHLTPITYAQTRLPNGYLIESSGPITMNQAALAAAGAGAAFWGPKLFPSHR